jgi:hypothetical protein
MQLRFLGTTYTPSNDTINTIESGLEGTYRGQSVLFRGTQPKPLNSAVALRYRGQSYLR